LRGVSLVVQGRRVARPAVLLIDDGSGEKAAQRQVLAVALARCSGCKGRFRVLPAEVMPFKRYGLDVIATTAAAHAESNRSLRTAAWTTHTGQTPAHSTLHAWTEGLGAYALGRPFGSLPGAQPFQAIVATVAARWSSLATTPIVPCSIDPLRYRSEARHERLVAVSRTLAVARAVVAAAVLVDGKPPLCAFRRLAIDLGVPLPFAFRTGIPCTPFEHGVTRDRQSPGLPQPTGDSRCQIRTRSPPFASSRSLPSSIPPSIPANDGT
jgi:hypothetical protein